MIKGIREALADFLSILRKDGEKTNKKITDGITTNTKETTKAINTQGNGVLKQLNSIEQAIKEQEVAESVSIKNPEAITGDLKAGLQGIIETLKQEVKKFDKTVVVKNDLGQLASAFKGSREKKDLLKGLDRIEKAVMGQEMTDYTMILSDIATTLENKDAVDVLKKILEKDYNVVFPEVMDVNLDPNLIEDSRVKTILPDDQVDKMSQAFVNGSNSSGVIEAINNISDLQQANDLEGLGNVAVGVTEVEIAITGTPESIRIRANTANTGIIYIGKTGVKSDGTNDFVRLESGDEIVIGYDDTTNALYAISDSASQNINIGVLL